LLLAVVAVVVAIGYFLLRSFAPTSLDERNYRPFKLVSKTAVNHNTIQFRFALPSPFHKLGLPVGKHMVLRFTTSEGKVESRAYTPVTSDDERGYFELVIKIYPDGKMSQHLKHLPLNSSVDIRGPLGRLSYKGSGTFVIKRGTEDGQSVDKTVAVKHVGMISGGTGLTPMLQVARDILKNSSDRTKITLIFANVTEEDILLRRELDAYAEKHSNFKVHYTLDKPTETWRGLKGFVTAQMIKDHMPPPADDVLICACGPPPMMKFMEKNFNDLKYTADQTFIF